MTVIPFATPAKPNKAAAERDALIRQARAIYESIFPTVPAPVKPEESKS